MQTPLTPPPHHRPTRELMLSVALLSSSLVMSACGGGATQTETNQVALSPQAREAQERLGPIQGEVTREKILDRLEGYELCGLTDPVQRGSLRFRFTKLKRGWQLIEVECFFFAIQGLYQFLAVHPERGAVTPLVFEGAPPAPATPGQGEAKSAVYLNQGRYELCGAPRFNEEQETLSTTCKGNATGTCGVFASYRLAWQNDPTGAPSFAPTQRRAQSCSLPSSSRNPEQWPNLR